MFKKEKGFTLIEMLIVLTIITVLILLIVPNLTDKSTSVHDKGCDALVQTVQAQVSAYQLDTGNLPSTLNQLQTEKYISEEQKTCKNGKALLLNQGIVTVEKTTN